MIELEGAWAAVHEALPAGWTVGRTSHHSEDRERPWHVVAVDLRSRALFAREVYVEATGWTEAEALRDLAALLGGWQHREDRGVVAIGRVVEDESSRLALQCREVAEALYRFAATETRMPSPRKDASWEELVASTDDAIRESARRQAECRELFGGRLRFLAAVIRRRGFDTTSIDPRAACTNMLAMRDTADTLGAISHRLLDTDNEPPPEARR